MKTYKSLKGKKKFREVIKKGRRYYRSDVQLIALKIDECADIAGNKKDLSSVCFQIGIQIGKRYGNAVTRNRARRRIRAICNEVLQNVDNDYLIIIRPDESFKSLTYLSSKVSIASLLTKAGLLKS
ncbi:MAG: ribonuclease P protein component [Spirochaetes bacterium]|nr:ribonuclease P protein component [Spirochaetota bacterium]